MRPLVYLILIILVGAVVLGLRLGDADVFNPHTSPAIVDQIRSKTAWQEAQDREALAHQQAMNQEEQRHQQEMNRIEEVQKVRDLERGSTLYSLAFLVSLVVIGILVATIGSSIAYHIYATGQSRFLEQKWHLIETEQQRVATAPVPQSAEVPRPTPSTVTSQSDDGRQPRQAVPSATS
jgi:hypothetical protein